MAHRVAAVEHGGVAEACGIEPGDLLWAINGESVLDQIDYQFLTAGERLVLTLEDSCGTGEIIITKDADEPLGLTLEDSFMSRPRACANRCVFCFIDQMPPGLRETLYVKDDDWRLSLMMGNYITLTNLSEKEFDRIIARRASPLYLSIHAMDGAVRGRMMGNTQAAGIRAQLQRLKDAGLFFHCQIVLCPGLNDGPVLDDTLEALAALMPAARSAALVPVGLTRYREGLAALTPFDRESAGSLLETAHAWQRKFLAAHGTRFIFPADEFYCLSGAPLPPDEAYETYPQLENGVGLLRSFENEFSFAYRYRDEAESKPRRVLVATGVSAAPFLRALLDDHPLDGIAVEIRAVENRFFGPSVTVAGLLTGQDLLHALKGAAADEILISQAMLRREDSLFLDDMPLQALSEALALPVHAIACDGAEFLDALCGVRYEHRANAPKEG
ncbi:MAG: DUF512 domain-containing protein [Firmicutes bacterium]|nr:DUF512 domain-containing protein [Bacillota bacterium]